MLNNNYNGKAERVVISTEQREWRNLFKGSLDKLEMTNNK